MRIERVRPTLFSRSAERRENFKNISCSARLWISGVDIRLEDESTAKTCKCSIQQFESSRNKESPAV